MKTPSQAFSTTIAGSLPKPAWLAETHKLWPKWQAEGSELQHAKADATVLWIKLQEDAGLDIVGDGEQSRQHFVHGFLEQVEGIDFEHKVKMGIRNNRYDAMVPQVVAPLRLKGRVHAVEAQLARAHTKKKLKFTLPGPMTIVDTCLLYTSGGGAAMPQAVAQRLLDLFGLRYVEGYGLTETAAPSHTNPPDAPKQQCLGIPFMSTDARIIDPETLQELPQGEAGEIIICGPEVFKGYWKRPDATAQAFIEHDGKRFFRSGDLGRVDEDGYFFMTDRLKRMINASGFKVWPAEVEALMFRHPAIQEACIISTKDAYRGESVKAVVVLRQSHRGQVSEQDLIDWCRDNMAVYKVPRVVQFVEALPKSGSGKVMWRTLQELEGS